MKNKKEQMTYEELTTLCRKQESYIKELEEKLKTSSATEKATEKIEVAKPDYEELCRQVETLDYKLNEKITEIDALKFSLTMIYQEMITWQNRCDTWETNYYREYNRANELFEKVQNNEK